MSIGIDYLARTGLIKQFLTLPCSLFITDCNEQKIAFKIEKSKNEFIVRKWLLSQTTASQVLPPFEEFNTTDVFADSRIILPKSKLLTFKHKSIPAAENYANKPMSTEKFEYYFDGYISNFSLHNTFKETFLWSVFIDVFHPELAALAEAIRKKMHLFEHLAQREIFYEQQQIVKESYLKNWKSWGMWKKHIFSTEGIPGELIFKSCFKD